MGLFIGDIRTFVGHLTLYGHDIAVYGIEKCRLSSTIGTNEADKFATIYNKVDLIYSRQSTKIFC